MIRISHISLLLTFAALLGACSSYEPDPRYELRSTVDSLHVALTISLDGAATTRAANPNGGEEGDGWEYGRDRENRLHDFTVFVLGGGLGINAADNTTFAGSRYFSEDEVNAVTPYKENIPTETAYEYANKDVLTYDFTIPVVRQTTPIEEGAYRFIIVANMGNLVGAYTTLGQLRDARPKQTWTIDKDGEATRFVMSNENDNYYTTGRGTADDPVRLHVQLERMAARIDYNPEGGIRTDDGKSLRYELKDDVDALLAHLYVDNLRLVNVAQPASYLIKRVADDLSGTNLVYLGDELPVPNGLQTNYVVEPNSTQKTVDNTTDNTLLTTLYGSTSMSSVRSLMPTLTTADVPQPLDGETIITLGYANENTFTTDATLSSYATGVCLRCRFEPKHDYYTAYDKEADQGDDEHTGLTAGTYTLGQTFTMVEVNDPALSEPRRLYFADAADAKAYATNTSRKHFATATTFTGGVCYYFFYLRHSNDVDVIHAPMEFATVRNNLYRFTLHTATGPGTPTPDPRHPEQLRATVYVRKWVEVVHPIIYV